MLPQPPPALTWPLPAPAVGLGLGLQEGLHLQASFRRPGREDGWTFTAGHAGFLQGLALGHRRWRPWLGGEAFLGAQLGGHALVPLSPATPNTWLIASQLSVGQRWRWQAWWVEGALGSPWLVWASLGPVPFQALANAQWPNLALRFGWEGL